MINTIDGAAFSLMIKEAAYSIETHKKELNDLNVFPVPDGDTGTNMSMTIGAAAKELEKSTPETAGEAANVAAMAMLRGARGNSGVILSLLFRGLSKRVRGLEAIDAQTFAEAMREGVDVAYKAVMRPAEGTILTVSMKASNSAIEAAKNTSSLRVTLTAALDTARRALAETTEQNPVLKKAGVVDAGGAGYVVILDTFLACAKGEVAEHVALEEDEKEEVKSSAFSKFNTEDIVYAYCTEFLIDRSGAGDPAQLREYLESIGDCVVVVEDEEIVKVHVHSNHPGLAIEKALELGALDKMKIENMKLQHTATLITEEQAADKTPAEPLKPAEPEEKKPYGFVAVAIGGGLHSIFEDLGVDCVVDGGQTMNPSTDDILKAVQSVNSDEVYVLPNNKNIIMAAQQVQPLTDKRVYVVKTRAVTEGISAMLAFEPDTAPEVNIEAMESAAGRVHTGEVTYAARDSAFDGRKIRRGDYMGICDGRIVDTGRRENDILKKLAREMCRRKEAEYVTVIYGEGTNESKAQELKEMFIRENRSLEVNIIYGGQPVYFFIISVE